MPEYNAGSGVQGTEDAPEIADEYDLGEGVDWTLADVGSAILDVPADAVNASTGTGENLGWFGEVDRHLDYRSMTGELDPNDPDDWADPSNEEAQGLSGTWYAVTGQTAAAGEDAADAAGDVTAWGFGQLLDNPALMALAALVVVYIVGQLFDVELGGASA